MTPEIIAVTGISGSGSKNFCKSYDSKDNKVKIYHTADMIYELAQYPKEPPIALENLLNLNPKKIQSFRKIAFDKIVNNLERDMKEYDKIIIDTHAQFLWNNVYENAYDWSYLNKIPIDMFVTIVDKPSSIKQRQLETADGKAQSHDLRDLLLWQNIEVNMTRGWARNYEKPMYVFSSKQNPKIMDSLLENHFLIYASFPMTDANSENNFKINNFKTRLRNLRKDIDGIETPMIDPADIDVETDPSLPEITRDTIDVQTVHRDLDWSIGQSTHVVSYYPSEKVDLSKGVSDEDTRAMEDGKFVYVICPRKRKSPFMKIASHVFSDEEEFFNFFKGHMKWALDYYKRSNFK